MDTLTLTNKLERRASVRYSCSLKSDCRPIFDDNDSDFDDNESDWPAYIREISDSGLMLAASRLFEPGTILAIRPRLSVKGAPYVLVAKVVRVSRNESPVWMWTLGCRFARELMSFEVYAFLE